MSPQVPHYQRRPLLRKRSLRIVIALCYFSILILIIGGSHLLQRNSRIKMRSEPYKSSDTTPSSEWLNKEGNRTEERILSSSILLTHRRPSRDTILMNNTYWQVLKLRQSNISSENVYLYGGYLDTRVRPALVRILISLDKYLEGKMRKPQYCHLWYPNLLAPLSTKVIQIENIWFSDWGTTGKYHPYLLSCPIPSSFEGMAEYPDAVSLVEERRDIGNNMLHINHKVPGNKTPLGVCVKALSYPNQDFSSRIVEWIEMLRILGADGIHFSLFSVHPNISKVLLYYEKLGIVTLKSTSIPGVPRNISVPDSNSMGRGMKRRYETIVYNDCFLTHMYKYEYLAVIDIDEVILPVGSGNLKTLVEKIANKSQTPCFEMILFVDKITEGDETFASAPTTIHKSPGYPYMMNKLSCESSKICNQLGVRGIKCLHNTENVYLVHNHTPRACFKGPCYFLVNTSMAYVHHHQDSCHVQRYDETKLSGSYFGFDPTILRFKETLRSATRAIYTQIGP